MKINKFLILTISSLALFQSVTVDARHYYRNYPIYPQVKNSPISHQNIQSQNYASEVLRLVNIERSKHGLHPLRLSNELNRAAQIRASEIVAKFSHTRPNGQPCHSLISNGAYTIGENIAAGNSSPESTVRQWMNSSGHRANILNRDFTELGVGYKQSLK